MRSRRGFLAAGLGSAVAIALQPDRMRLVAQGNEPALPAEQVEEFVRVAHGDLGRTKEMLDEESGLLNATWDWGAGDFETGLGGASHMGNKAIAGFLLGQGARIDLFCAAMMGMLDMVRPVVEAYPGAVDWKGPHGISLMRHAIVGEAEEVADFLRSRGAI